MNIASDKLGRRAELEFDVLSEQADLISSTPIPDRTGKDRLVEFDFVEPTGYLTFDTRPAPLACYVQVKGLHLRNTRIEMRLSAAERLARELKPTFIFAPRFDHELRLVDLHLIHVLDAVLGRILKRLRAEYAKGTRHLNRKVITVPIHAGKKIEPTGHGLRSALAEAISGDMAAYTASKHQQLKSLGYDENRFNINVSFQLDSIDQLVEGFLGRAPLPLKRFESFERRFNISLPGPPDLAEFGTMVGGALRITPKPCGRWIVRFSSELDGEIAALEGDAYLPGLPGLSAEHVKALVRTPTIDITIPQNRVAVESNSGVGEAQPLEIWLQAFMAWKILAGGGCTVSVTALDSGEEILSGTCPGGINGIGDVHSILDLVKAAANLRQLAGAADTPTKLDDLLANRKAILVANGLMTQKEGEARFTLTTDTTDELDLPQGSLTVFLSAVVVGKDWYAYAVRGILAVEREEDSLRWVLRNGTPLTIEQLTGSASDAYDAFCNKLCRIAVVDNAIRFQPPQLQR